MMPAAVNAVTSPSVIAKSTVSEAYRGRDATAENIVLYGENDSVVVVTLKVPFTPPIERVAFVVVEKETDDV